MSSRPPSDSMKNPSFWYHIIIYHCWPKKSPQRAKKELPAKLPLSRYSQFSIIMFDWLRFRSNTWVLLINPLISCNPSWAPSKSGHLITCTLPPDAASWADKGSQPMIRGVRVMLWIKWRGQRTPGKCPQRAITNLNMQQYVTIKYLSKYIHVNCTHSFSSILFDHYSTDLYNQSWYDSLCMIIGGLHT